MKRYSDEWWQGVKDFNNSFPINIFKKDKEMTESVAYMSEEGVLFKELPPNPMFKLTPLYKLRELTDEEILDTAKTMPTIDGATMEEAYILFARAILKKAREK
tara:strand:+ start:20630 stop:20938 length:309 start_codon:yes stop_codon:yes gene_type:complete